MDSENLLRIVLLEIGGGKEGKKRRHWAAYQRNSISFMKTKNHSELCVIVVDNKPRSLTPWRRRCGRIGEWGFLFNLGEVLRLLFG